MVTERCQETEISGNKENQADRDIHVCFPRQNFITSDIAVLLFVNATLLRFREMVITLHKVSQLNFPVKVYLI